MTLEKLLNFTITYEINIKIFSIRDEVNETSYKITLLYITPITHLFLQAIMIFHVYVYFKDNAPAKILE